MSEIDDVLKKLEDDRWSFIPLGYLDIKEKARRLMAMYPETSSWEIEDFKELFKRYEENFGRKPESGNSGEDFKKQVLSDHL